jgi:hypothetical protein
MVGAARLCPPEKSVLGFVAAVLVLSAGLVAICWWKGEAVNAAMGAFGCRVLTARACFIHRYRLSCRLSDIGRPRARPAESPACTTPADSGV